MTGPGYLFFVFLPVVIGIAIAFVTRKRTFFSGLGRSLLAVLAGFFTSLFGTQFFFDRPVLGYDHNPGAGVVYLPVVLAFIFGCFIATFCVAVLHLRLRNRGSR